jgi:acetyltransferase-like isoleucine patch superfamily enzyme
VIDRKDVFIHPKALVEGAIIGEKTRIWAFAHILSEVTIGRNCNIGDHCFIEGKVRIGHDVVIKNGVSIWEGVVLEDRVFVGPNAAFTNDVFPRAKVAVDEYKQTLVKQGASIGANATMVAPVKIGRYALIGAGSVVTRDIPDFALAYGNPAVVVGFVCRCGRRLPIELEEDGSARCSCGLVYHKQGLILSEA